MAHNLFAGSEPAKLTAACRGGPSFGTLGGGTPPPSVPRSERIGPSPARAHQWYSSMAPAPEVLYLLSRSRPAGHTAKPKWTSK